MSGLEGTVADIERRLRVWLPAAFVKAAAIEDRTILPEERALVARAVEVRQREFATGRWLAHEGLRHLGLPDRPIGMGRLREPLWPKDILGTISHDGALCAVALMARPARAIAGIGIDLVHLARRNGRMDDLTALFVADPTELHAAARLGLAVDPALLLFSLKEAAVKALAYRLADFVDLRAFVIGGGAPLTLRIAGEAIDAAFFAATVGDYLVTAALARG